MTKDEFSTYLERRFETIRSLRAAGQNEYSHNESAFDNFQRLAGELNLTPPQVLWVYARKHIDGIVSYLKGKVSQREPVQGRIDDLIVYLFLLRGMVDEGDGEWNDEKLLAQPTSDPEVKGHGPVCTFCNDTQNVTFEGTEHGIPVKLHQNCPKCTVEFVDPACLR